MADAANETIKTVNSRIVDELPLKLPEKKLRPPRAGGKNPTSGWSWRKASPKNPVGQIKLPSKRISLIHFLTGSSALNKSTKRPRRGLLIGVFTDKPKARWAHAFIRRGRNIQDKTAGPLQVWQRETKETKRGPIVKLAGPSVQHVIETDKKKYARVAGDIPALLAKRLDQQIERQILKINNWKSSKGSASGV